MNTHRPIIGFEMQGWTVVYNPENAEEWIAMRNTE